jgi:hypothetical protein
MLSRLPYGKCGFFLFGLLLKEVFDSWATYYNSPPLSSSVWEELEVG